MSNTTNDKYPPVPLPSEEEIASLKGGGMTPLQQHIYKAYLELKRICEQNDIQFWASGGTLIGTIDYRGFISWDDDMDIYMPRADYERFIEIVLNENNEQYGISCMEDGRHLCPYYFAKFYATDSTVWEQKMYPVIIGPWIDIFPLDEYNDEEGAALNDEYIIAHAKYRRSIAIQSWRDIAYDIFHFRGMNGWMGLIRKCWSSLFRKKYFKRINELKQRISQVKGDIYRYYGQGWSGTEIAQKHTFEKKYIGTPKWLPFEDTSMSVPEFYHEILIKGYPRYWTTPPEEERYGGHPCYYVDLDHVKTIEQVRAEVGNDHERSTTIFTFAEFWNTFKNRFRHLW